MKLKVTKQNPNNQSSSIDLDGEPVYIGIDVHKDQWKVTIRVGGMEMSTFSMNPSVEELVSHLQKNYPGGEYYSAYEVGFCGFSIHRQLEARGLENAVVNASDIPSLQKERMTKTDTVDSRKICRELERGTLSSIYIPTTGQEALRQLCRWRRKISIEEGRMKVRIKSFLNFIGFKLPSKFDGRRWSGKFISYLRELRFAEELNTVMLQSQLNVLESLRREEVLVLRRIREEVRNDEEKQRVMNLLLTVPGVGIATGLAIYSEIMDMKRFSSLDRLKSFVGLSPAVYSSGDKMKVLGLSWRYNKYLRNMLIESAWVAVHKDPALLSRFLELSRRMSRTNAIIRIAKKLLNRIMHVWNTGLPYERKVA